MSPSTEERILLVLDRIENKQDEQGREISDVKGRVIALDSAHKQSVQFCRLTHKTVDKRLDDLEDDNEKTGEHEVQDLREQLKRRDDSRTHWSRWAVMALVGALLTVIASVASGVTVARLNHQQTTQRSP